jgi:transcriptional regulator with XRE-family HTH domain
MVAEFADAVSAALSSGANPVTALREASGYTIEQLAVVSGLATSEIVELEGGIDTDSTKVARLAAALGLPEGGVA